MPEYTEINCATPESAHALHAYLLAELGQEEGPPNISATVEDSALKVVHNHDNQAARRERDVQLIGYRDGRESVEGALRESRHVFKELRRSVIDDFQAERMIDDAVETINSVLGNRTKEAT
ncbi:MAG TPA: hypothetical protein VF290_02525 [Pyrinomonadaceae bacterium]